MSVGLGDALHVKRPIMVDGDTYYDVHFDDEWLRVEDFRTIRAGSEDEAEQRFRDEHVDDEDRYDINSVEYAYTNPDI